MYSLISGVGIFFLGAGVTCYHGILNLIHPPTLEALPIVSHCVTIAMVTVRFNRSLCPQAFSVLGASLLMESGKSTVTTHPYHAPLPHFCSFAVDCAEAGSQKC